MKTHAPPLDLDDHGPLPFSHLRRPLVAAVLVILILLATARSSQAQAPPAGDYGDAPDGASALTHNPPATPEGTIEVPVTIDGPTGSFRLCFSGE